MRRIIQRDNIATIYVTRKGHDHDDDTTVYRNLTQPRHAESNARCLALARVRSELGIVRKHENENTSNPSR